MVCPLIPLAVVSLSILAIVQVSGLPIPSRPSTSSVLARDEDDEWEEDDCSDALDTPDIPDADPNKNTTSNCFPAVGFNMPSDTPTSLDGWWCDPDTEYAFVGFSYEVTACQSKDTLTREFQDIRQTFKGRYVRLYGACDRDGFYDDIVDAAWSASLGVHALIWFGFDGGNIWQKRRDTLFDALHKNPKARFVTRLLQFGSEPLYDGVLSVGELTDQVNEAKQKLGDLQIPVTISDMAYGFQRRGGAQELLDAVDMLDIHILPFFSEKASTGGQAWPLVKTDLNWFFERSNGKKIWMSQNGWPSVTSEGVSANSDNAVADVKNEAAYFKVLDNECSYFKEHKVGWLAHIYSDNQEPGYGIYDYSGKEKFNFRPRVTCQ